MSDYRIRSISGGDGFKVDVASQPGGLRVVGVFLTKSDAEAWIIRDRRKCERPAEIAGWEPAP